MFNFLFGQNFLAFRSEKEDGSDWPPPLESSPKVLISVCLFAGGTSIKLQLSS